MKIAGYDVDEKHVEEFKKWIYYIIKGAVILLSAVILLLVAFKRKGKGKQSKSSIRNIWKNMCP